MTVKTVMTIKEVDKIAEAILKESKHNRHRDHFFPLLIDKLDLQIGAEIGVDKGEFAKIIAEKSHIQRYYGIDSWLDCFGSDPKAYDPIGENRYKAAEALLDSYITSKRIELVKMDSELASAQCPINLIDYLYIDGDHSLGGIFIDLKCWCPKVKIGGIISGHDYKDGKNSGIRDFKGEQLDYGVKIVVDYWCQRYGYKLNIVGGRILSWWFYKDH